MSKDRDPTVSRLDALRTSMRDSLRALLGRRSAAPTQFMGGDEETIREALIALLPDPDPMQTLPWVALKRKLRYAPDCEALWYLRSDVLRAIAAVRGEEQARQQIAAIDHLFPPELTRRR